MSELVTVLSIKDVNAKRHTSLSRKSNFFWIPLLIISIYNYDNILMYSALLVGFLEGREFLKFYPEIQNSRCNYVLEKGFWRTEKIFYFFYPL